MLKQSDKACETWALRRCRSRHFSFGRQADPEVKRTYHAVREAMEIEEGSRDLHGNNKAKTLRSPLRHLFTGGRSQNLRRASLGVINQCFQQITGINLIT
jgi:hypothetical protein